MLFYSFFVMFCFILSFFYFYLLTNLLIPIYHRWAVACSESARVNRKLRVLKSRDFIILSVRSLWSMLRGAASALLRTCTDISSLSPVLSTVLVARQSSTTRPFSTSLRLNKKKKQKSLWLQLDEGRTMDGNIEEILAPLRLAVKEQVASTGMHAH